MIIRQGDLIMRRVGELPTAMSTTPKALELAHGETSGHWHEVTGVLERERTDDRAGLVAVTGDAVTVGGQPWRHEPLPLQPGMYEFWIQREYTPKAVRSVAD